MSVQGSIAAGPVETRRAHAEVPIGTGIWDEKELPKLKVNIGDLKDNTTAFTRGMNAGKPGGTVMRYYERPVTFTFNGETSLYLAHRDVYIPYIPPPPTQGRSNPSKYGVSYVYACLVRGIAQAIANDASQQRGLLVATSEPKVASTEDDWWVTLNFQSTSKVFNVQKEGKQEPVVLARILNAMKSTLTCTLVVSMKLKCSLEELKGPDGKYMSLEESTHPGPDSNTMWNIAVTPANAVITGMDQQVIPPERTTGAPEPVVFAPSADNDASQKLLEELAKLGI